MILFEEGKFLLDDAVSKYIPEFKKPQVLDKFNEADSSYTTIPAKREITIRDLLTHTSGIGYAQIGSKTMNAIYAKAGVIAGIGMGGKPVLADKMKILGGLPLVHQPGEKWTYGLNTDLLGYLVEVISGMPLDKFLTTRIFEPLGMKDTYFYLPKEKYSRLATLYTVDSTDHAVKAPEHTDINADFYKDYPNTQGHLFLWRRRPFFYRLRLCAFHADAAKRRRIEWQKNTEPHCCKINDEQPDWRIEPWSW